MDTTTRKQLAIVNEKIDQLQADFQRTRALFETLQSDFAQKRLGESMEVVLNQLEDLNNEKEDLESKIEALRPKPTPRVNPPKTTKRSHDEDTEAETNTGDFQVAISKRKKKNAKKALKKSTTSANANSFATTSTSSSAAPSNPKKRPMETLSPATSEENLAKKIATDNHSDDEPKAADTTDTPSASVPQPSQPQTTAQKKPAARRTLNNRQPPLVLKDAGKWMDLQKKILSMGLNYTKAVNVKEGISITPASAEDYRGIFTIFESDLDPTRGGFYTYQLPEERPLKVVIRGINVDIQTDQVSADLTKQGFSISQVARMHSGRYRHPIPLVLVTLEKTEANRSIFDVKVVIGLDVRVETPYRKARVSQCHRCQGFGHSQRNCRSCPKCVKCAAPHLTQSCEKTKDKKATCANCGGDHPASYQGCPSYPKMKRTNQFRHFRTDPPPKGKFTPHRATSRTTYAERTSPPPPLMSIQVEMPTTNPRAPSAPRDSQTQVSENITDTYAKAYNTLIGLVGNPEEFLKFAARHHQTSK